MRRGARLALALAALLLAAPSDVLVMGGSSTGAATPAPTPLYSTERDFEDGANGASIAGQADGLDFQFGGNVYDAGDGYNGTQGARSDLVGDPVPCTGATDQWGGVIDLPTPAGKGREVRFRVRVKFPVGWSWDTNGVGMKFLRMQRYTVADVSAGFLDLYFHDGTEPSGRQPYLINENAVPDDSRTYFGNGTTDDPTLGTWETWEVRARLDDVPQDAGGFGSVKVYKNGVMLVERTDEPTLNLATHTVRSLLLNTYWNGLCEAPVQDQSVWFDDVLVEVYQ